MPQANCLPETDIQAYLLGDLSDARARIVALHLESCTTCESHARQLDSRSDSLLRSLQCFLSSLPLRPGAVNDSVPDAAPAEHLPPSNVAGYEVLGELGRGGMSVVYKARQLRPTRLVALKMILAGQHAGAELRARFLSEAEAIARLQHPNIVQVFEVGLTVDVPFFSLELVEGGTLHSKLGGAPQPPRQAAMLVETLARAVHYAHDHGVIHRDLKPANVLLRLDGSPCIVDFGLARLEQAVPDELRHVRKGLTVTGAVLGTPSYMAPEQAQGRSKDVGPPADIYALGAILYEMLTGRPPFTAETPLDTLFQVVSDDPVPPRRLNPTLPQDLDTICLKCLHKEPRRRYASAAALADDLRRFCENRPILARPSGPLASAWRWSQRNRAVAGLLAAVLVVLIAGITGTTMMWLQARDNLQQSEKNLSKAEDNFRDTFQAVDRYFRSVSEDRLLAEPGMLGLRKELLEGARPFYERFAESRADDPRMRRELALAFERLATIEMTQGAHNRSLALRNRALELYEGLLEHDPEDAGLAVCVARCLQNRGQCLLVAGHFAEAERDLTEALRRQQSLANQDGGQARADPIAALQLLGELANGQGKPKEALGLNRRALKLAEQAARAHAEDPFVQCNCARQRSLVGQRLLQAGQAEEALKELQRARNDYTPLVQRPSGVQAMAREGLAVTCGALALVYSRMKTPDEAVKAALESDKLWQGLTLAFPEVAFHRSNRASNADNLNLMYFHAKPSRPQDALPWARLAVELREEIYKADRNNHQAIYPRANSHRLLANTLNRLGNREEALRINRQVEDILVELLARHPAHEAGRELLVRTAAGRGQILFDRRSYAESLAEWDLALRHDRGTLRLVVLGYRARARAHCRDWIRAIEDVGSAMELRPSGDALYSLAQAQSLCSDAVGRDPSLPQAQREQKADQIARQAIELLTQLHKSGYFSASAKLSTLESDRELDPLRVRADFKALFRTKLAPPAIPRSDQRREPPLARRQAPRAAKTVPATRKPSLN